MSSLVKFLKWLYYEFGIGAVFETGRDAWFVILARTSRMFAFGAISLIFALFFAALDFTDPQIGVFMTLTLVGDVVLSMFLTMVADRFGRRRILLLGGALMAMSGAIFWLSDNFWILLFASVVGVVSATGGDFGPFRAIEESTLSHLTTPKTRSDVLSWYVTASSFGSALGTESTGRFIDFMKGFDGWTELDAYHITFWTYIIMGVSTMFFAILMSDKSELKDTTSKAETEASETLLNEMRRESGDGNIDSGESTENLNSNLEQNLNAMNKRKKSKFSQISAETRRVMYKLWVLLAIDSLADGMVSYALTTYYLDRKFHFSKSTLGNITAASYFLMAFSTIFAGPLAKRLGLINTMVFTHIPSSAAVLFFPIGTSVPLTISLLLIRTGLNNMDQAPRAAFIAAAVKPEERTAVMGITGMLRTLASMLGPSLTGWLAGIDKFWVAYVVAGSLRLAYDFGLWMLFVNMKLNMHEENNDSSDSRRKFDEEEVAGGELEMTSLVSENSENE